MEVNDYLVIAMFVSFIGLLFTGFPIAWVLGGTAVIFTGVGMLADRYLDAFTGIDYLVFSMSINRIYRLMYNWVLVALPMFIFMGLVMEKTRIAEDLLLALVVLVGLLTPLAQLSGLPFGLFLVGIFFLYWGYGVFFETLWNGRTPGASIRSCGFRRAFRPRTSGRMRFCAGCAATSPWWRARTSWRPRSRT